MPRTIVLGGAGFVGSHLCKYILDTLMILERVPFWVQKRFGALSRLLREINNRCFYEKLLFKYFCKSWFYSKALSSKDKNRVP